MNKRIAFLIVCLVICLLTGSALLVKDSAAQTSPTWLSFDGSTTPGLPEMVLLSADPLSIELHASLPGAQVETAWSGGQAFSRVSGEGYGFSTGIGQPQLPVLRQAVEIPYGAQASIEMVSAKFIEVSLAELGLHSIYPLQPPQVKLAGAQAPFALDVAVYAQGSFSPGNPLAIREPYIVRGHRILPVEVWPVAYDPVAGTLRLYSQVTFRIRLEGADMPTTSSLAQRYASPEFDRSLSQQVLNFNQGLALPKLEAVGYLIITADAYYDAMLPFVTLRQSHGFDVTMTRMSQISGGTTQDIKNYIQNAYDTWLVPPSYVLLVGDTNTVPTWTGLEIDASTDLYYATMDGTEDWHADLGRGRFPVRSTAQTTAMVNKYLAYAALSGLEPWLKTASFPATCDLEEVAEGSHNYVIDSYTLPGGWTGTFPNDPQPGGDKLYCITYTAEHQDLIDAFNQGRWAIIYSGHGSYNGWEMDFTPTDVANLTNAGMFPFVASHACLSGDFGQDEVFGETWVLGENQGALAFYGSSTYTYWDEDDTLERTYFDELYSGAEPAADITVMTEAGLAGVETAYPDMARYYRETYNILGDPAVRLYLPPDSPTFTLQVAPTSHEVCTPGSVYSSVEIGSLLDYAQTVYLGTGTLPSGVTASFDPASAAAPYTSTLTLGVSAGAPAGSHLIDVTASDGAETTKTAPLTLSIFTAVPAMPIPLSPSEDSLDQPLQPLFTWQAPPLATQQHFQLADSAVLENILLDVNALTQSSYQPSTPLEGGRCYWWQVNASNICGEGAWSNLFHFATLLLDIDFTDDIESGGDNWTHQATQGTDHWEISTNLSHSPSHAWFVPDDSSLTDTHLWNTTPVVLGTGRSLSFWHQYQFEGEGYDGAVLELSTDGGSTWTDLGPYITTNGYNGTISTSFTNPLGGRSAWVGDLATWTEVIVDLSGFAGESVNIRWRLGCDLSVSDTGWYIDDVQITAPQPSAPAPLLQSITPVNGGTLTTITLTGTGFFGTPSIALGDTWLQDVTVLDGNTITATIPAGLRPGSYDLKLYNGDCQYAELLNAFEVTGNLIVFLPSVLK